MKKHRECAFSAELDMQTLLIAKGPGFPLDMLSERLFCPMCRQCRMRVLFSPGVDSDAAAAARRYRV